MTPATRPDLVFRRCDLSDLPELLRLAQLAFATDAFYRVAFGFDEQDFATYWRAFYRMALEDPTCDTVALVEGDQIRACSGTALHSFPRADLWERCRAELESIPPERRVVFERFLDAYEQVMTVSPDDARIEAKIPWVFIDPPYRKYGLMARMLMEWAARYRPPNITRLSGFANADAPGLLDSYRRLGFSVDEPRRIHGLHIARLVIPLGPPLASSTGVAAP